MEAKTCNQVGDIPYAALFSEKIVAGKISGDVRVYGCTLDQSLLVDDVG